MAVYLIIEETTNIHDEKDIEYHGICNSYEGAYDYVARWFKDNNNKTDLTTGFSQEGTVIYPKSLGGYHCFILHQLEVLEPLG